MSLTSLRLLLYAAAASAIAHFNLFRELNRELATEWTLWRMAHGSDLGNTALLHHQAVDVFCRQRAPGCTWAEYHALVDHSRQPHAHLFDARRLMLEALPPRPTACARLHKPTAEQLLEQVKAAAPAVISGLLEGWPALERWTDEYLTSRLGGMHVGVSVSDVGFDHPEDARAWSVPASANLTRVVARPAHEMTTFGEAVAAMRRASNLTRYLEYFPVNTLELGVPAAYDGWRLARDLQPPSAGAADTLVAGEDAPKLRNRGEAEAAVLRPARWLMPRKQLLWMGGGGTVGSTHYDPYENLMAMVSGSKTFYLAHPDDGDELGGHTRMAEGRLELGAAETLARSAEAVGEATKLHHYAAKSLRDLAEAGEARREGSGGDSGDSGGAGGAGGARVLRCTARAGEVVYTPAYWWHEVVSSSDELGREAGGAARRSVIGVNWFYEPYYQRIMPNMSFDRSPHYALLETQAPLDDPFPPPPAGASVRPSAAPPRASRFESRLRSRRAGGDGAAALKGEL